MTALGVPAPQANRSLGDCRTSATTTVGVVITTFNHAHFLADALRSVEAQTRPADAVVVVDDGSQDKPAAVTAMFPNVRLITRENGGLAAARNTGLAALQTEHIVFLDADDCLEPRALEAGLDCFALAPASGFVYGAHRSIDGNGRPLGASFDPPGEDPYEQLLRRNFIAMHGAVMYRRDRLLAIGGFDQRLRYCEDYELYLRMARAFPVAAHTHVVASYRRHGANMSLNHRAMLRATLTVHAWHAPRASNERARLAWSEGRRHWRRYYAEAMAAARYQRRQRGGTLAESVPALVTVAAVAPAVALRELTRAFWRLLKAPSRWVRRTRQARSGPRERGGAGKTLET